MCGFRYVLLFFFKQKTAYEMRISDWSSDVCSSDLGAARHRQRPSPPAGGRADRDEPPLVAGAGSAVGPDRLALVPPRPAARRHCRRSGGTGKPDRKSVV